ncbi:PREDICTED: zinc finger protein 567-like [Nanorana parkeri]|uniref:zinc finger protein 567-like n=1 Tax=Nanorana parkeri TaxID=125878 RepID=UPI0008546C89|nr:PREDICTED: zinc finger protein 567-like [Nanorana parkeri]
MVEHLESSGGTMVENLESSGGTMFENLEHDEIPQARPLHSRDSTKEHYEIPQARPLYSRDSTKEHDEIPQARPLHSRDSTKELDEIPQARPLYSQDSTKEHDEIPQDSQAEDLFGIKVKNMSDEGPYVRGEESYKEKEIPPEISRDGPLTRNTPERCPSPIHSRESTCKPRRIRQRCPRQDVVVIKVEDSDDEEEPYVRGDEACKEDDVPPEISTDPQKDFKDEVKRHMKDKEDGFHPEISTDGRYIRNNSDKCPTSYPDVEIEDDEVTTDSTDESTITPSFHPILNSADLSSDPSTHGGCFPDFPRPVVDPSVSWNDIMTPCFDLNECFSQRAKLHARQKAQKGSESVSCSECGKSFAHKSNLITHERIHNSDRPYPCSICGKRFTQKSHLVTHKRIHTGEKPYSCSTCGKSFTDKSNLVAHQRTHTGLKPYSCPECGKSFGRRAYLLDHQRENKCERVWYFK